MPSPVDTSLLQSLPAPDKYFKEWDEIEDSWATYCEKPAPMNRWIFRGHSNETYPLDSTLERSIVSFSQLRDSLHGEDLRTRAMLDGLQRRFSRPAGPITAQRIENGLIRRFERQYHHFGKELQAGLNKMELLALMRHYGAPTRLVDWTWSFFVALFFAVHTNSDNPSVVWALNLDAVEATYTTDLLRNLKDDPNLKNDGENKVFDEVFKSNRLGVVNLSPLRLNDRLVVQQGTFLLPRNIAAPFKDNLEATLRQTPPQALLQFRIDKTARTKGNLLQRLQRMNITEATLFPGLDGFARSLQQLLAFPDVIDSPTKKELFDTAAGREV